MPAKKINSEIKKINKNCLKNKISITSTFTGTFTRVNHLAHPDKDMQKIWINWFKKYTDISIDLGATSMGSHFGIFTWNDLMNKKLLTQRKKQNIEAWCEIAAYAKKKGLKFISWEPMSIKREQGETIKSAKKLHDLINKRSSLPFKICFDVDHGDVSSKNKQDTNPDAWIKYFKDEISYIHIKQSSKNKLAHWPFTKKYNKIGSIVPKKLINLLEKSNLNNTELLFELSFREREPTESKVIAILKESVSFWKPFVE